MVPTTLGSFSRALLWVVLITILFNTQCCDSFSPSWSVYGGFRLQYTAFRNQRTLPILYLSDEDQPDADGASLAAEFLKMAQSKGIELDANELDDDDEEEEEESDDTGIPEEEEEEDRSGLTVTLTDDKLYSEVKERVLDTAGGFVEFVKGAKDEDDEASEEDEEVKPKVYEPPSKVPDPALTAGEVVSLVLEAFRNNDNPTPNRGVEIFFGYSSPGSQVKQEAGLTPQEYVQYLRETDYKILFTHDESVIIEKGDYSADGKKAFFTVGIKTSLSPLDKVSVNFILSTSGVDDEASWLIDSMLIRPPSMRRNRRR